MVYGNKYTNLDIEIEVNNNETFVLPIHKTYTTYDPTNGNEIISYAYYDFYIDYGDGTSSSHVICNGRNNNIWNETRSNIKYHYPDPSKLTTQYTRGISHTYEQKGRYIISISIPTNGRLDTLYVHIDDKDTWKKLLNIYNLSWLNFKSYGNSFCNAINLKTIPNHILIPETVTNFYNTSYMFYNCENIKYIPKYFILSPYLINTSYMFYNCFSSTIYTDNFNENLFKTKFINGVIPINVQSMFENCSGLNGYVFSKNLWYSNTNHWTSIDCFKNCINIENYRFIPEEWGRIR